MKTNLIIERDLKNESDLVSFNDEVEKIVEPFGATCIGTGCFMPTMTRDWQYEVDTASASIIAKKLKNAGYSVETLASVAD